ncbi:MAG: hypothetical protein II916_05445 [Oscillospiraceae bacterium]|nr:hypothetical protein [Oscillospiraceae bacterium]
MIYLRGMQDYTLTVGTVTVHLHEYRITGGCLLRETGTAEGAGAVAAIYPKGTRIQLKGCATPPLDQIASVGAALDTLLRDGSTQDVRLGLLKAKDVRLIGYTMELSDTAADLTLVLYTDVPLEEVGA